MKKEKGQVPIPVPNNFEPNRLTQQRDKNSHFLVQEKRVFKAFFGTPKTMLEVSLETGVLRANICRYVANWLDSKSIQLVRVGFCSISLHKAGRYSTNPAYWEKGGKNAG